MSLGRLAQLLRVLGRAPRPRPAGDDSQRLSATRLVDELRGQRVGDDTEHPQFRRPERAGYERRDDDAGDEDRSDLDAFRPLEDVGDARVYEDNRDREKGDPAVALAPRGDGD